MSGFLHIIGTETPQENIENTRRFAAYNKVFLQSSTYLACVSNDRQVIEEDFGLRAHFVSESMEEELRMVKVL